MRGIETAEIMDKLPGEYEVFNRNGSQADQQPLQTPSKLQIFI